MCVRNTFQKKIIFILGTKFISRIRLISPVILRNSNSWNGRIFKGFRHRQLAVGRAKFHPGKVRTHWVQLPGMTQFFKCLTDSSISYSIWKSVYSWFLCKFLNTKFLYICHLIIYQVKITFLFNVLLCQNFVEFIYNCKKN